MCRVDYDDAVTMLATYDRVARKAHRCRECKRQIEPKEKYLEKRFAFEGTAESCHTCLHCLALRNWLQNRCGGFAFGDVLEDFAEHVLEEPEALHLRQALNGAYAKWRGPHGQLMEVPTI